MRIKRALLSVYDKVGVVDLAAFLSSFSVEIFSTGTTADLLLEAGIEVIKISDYTGYPEVMDGRVKTLHPKIYQGILADRSNVEHLRQMEDSGSCEIDLVVVNLYPFLDVLSRVEKFSISTSVLVENIDIGGVSLMRAAAKNFEHVCLLSEIEDYEVLKSDMRENDGCVSSNVARRFAGKGFRLTCLYDFFISQWFDSEQGNFEFRDEVLLCMKKSLGLRYGENPHQRAAFYRKALSDSDIDAPAFRQIHGKELSYGNFLDFEASLSVVMEFANNSSAVIVKHANPCGFAVSEDLCTAYLRALECDERSSFGGVVAISGRMSVDLAELISGRFFEIVAASAFDDDALALLCQKKNLRILEYNKDIFSKHGVVGRSIIRSTLGGFLVQESNDFSFSDQEVSCVTELQPTPQQVSDLLFAMNVVKYVKSNAIVLAKDMAIVGVGAGQMSRVDSLELAIRKSSGRCVGSVMASDAFFPFCDSIEIAKGNGIAAIIQPGGSIRDDEVINMANSLGIAMLFTKSVRCFLH